jgi:hypothetical protein
MTRFTIRTENVNGMIKFSLTEGLSRKPIISGLAHDMDDVAKSCGLQMKAIVDAERTPGSRPDLAKCTRCGHRIGQSEYFQFADGPTHVNACPIR